MSVGGEQSEHHFYVNEFNGRPAWHVHSNGLRYHKYEFGIGGWFVDLQCPGVLSFAEKCLGERCIFMRCFLRDLSLGKESGSGGDGNWYRV